METISVGSTVVASPSQVSMENEGEALILNSENGTYFGLDHVGARIWELLAEPRGVAELRDRLAAEYDVEPDRCESDLLELLGELGSAGLIEVSRG